MFLRAFLAPVSVCMCVCVCVHTLLFSLGKLVSWHKKFETAVFNEVSFFFKCTHTFVLQGTSCSICPFVWH